MEDNEGGYRLYFENVLVRWRFSVANGSVTADILLEITVAGEFPGFEYGKCWDVFLNLGYSQRTIKCLVV